MGRVWGAPEPPHTSPPGIDLMDMASDILQPQGDDVARTSWHLRNLITRYQETFSVIEKVWRLEAGKASHLPTSPEPALTPFQLFLPSALNP